MCIWNFGFLGKGDGGGQRTAFEIRYPRGSDEDVANRNGKNLGQGFTRLSKRKPAIGYRLTNERAMSREMQMFDEFLERVVRPRVDSLLNTTK